MNLRPRLALTLLAIMVPLLAAVIYADTLSRQDAAERSLARFVRMVLNEPGVRARCEASPDGALRPPAMPRRAGPPAPPPGAFSGAQGPDFPPPPFGAGPPPPGELGHRKPANLRRVSATWRLATGDVLSLSGPQQRALDDDDVVSLSRVGERDVARILIRTPWAEGSCAYVLVTGSTEVWLGGFLPPTLVWLLPIALVLLAVWLAVGPPVRRLARLAQEVRAERDPLVAPRIDVRGHDEITEVARAFDAKSRELAAELRERTRREAALRDFLANTSHDVMVPLTVLLGHLSALRSEDGLEGASADALRGALDEAHYVSSLIQNLSLTASLDAAEPRVERARVDLGAVVERIIARHAPIARQLQVALDYAVPQEPLSVIGDVTMIEQAVSNLTYNALRYNRAGGHVAVLLEASDADFRLEVLDDGPGVAEGELGRLLERGLRTDSARARAPEGKGLGLSITQRVAELHDLTLTLKNRAGGGFEARLSGRRRSGV